MQTEPEQWAVVQEVETVTGDFLTEPGVPFYRIVIDGYCADFDHRQAAENFVAAIQRAFEERERKLREEAKRETELLNLAVRAQEALQASAYRAGMKFGWNCCDAGASEKYAQAMEGTEHIAELKRIRQARQALKETPDAG